MKIIDFCVADLMNKGVTSIKETASVKEALQLMIKNNVSSLFVLKEHDKDAYGILTRKDIVVEACEDWDTFLSLKVKDLCSKPVLSVQGQMGIKHVCNLMKMSGVRRLAVIDNEQIVGMISNNDIFRKIIALTQAIK